jgi:cephalosporin-C deacetylase-like acetyl esterase/lysophospholipase L1-like esterase
MSARKRVASGAIFALILLLAAAPLCSAQQLTLTPFKASGIYGVGEKVGWTASLPPGAAPTGDFKFIVKKNNFQTIKTGRLDFSSGSATIEVTLNEPAMVYVLLTPPPNTDPGAGAHGTTILAVGAAVAPQALQPSAPRPPDFDAFWDSKIKMLLEIPQNALLIPKDSPRPDIEYDTIRMDHINGTHVFGQLAKPKREGKFPGLVIFQWASPPYPLQPQWVTDRAAEGWLALNIEPHDVLPDQPRAYYHALPQSLKNYAAIGRDDRDKNYFLQMYLADYRAVDYLASRPDWDGKTLVVMGTSMGGQQSLCVAGLNPKVTALIVDEPSACDTNGPLHGRASGYPNWPANNPRIMETALYFDAVNFASRIKIPSLVAMGFVDTTAPPVGIWTAFDQIQGPKEAVPMVDSPHNHLATPAQQRPFTIRSAQWLNILLHGGQVKPNDISDIADSVNPDPAADQPVARGDENSMIAHAQLLEKAKKDRIDIYFEGDSITRRWGATDPQYKDLLLNWKQNFFGWNAANFGWGGDTAQNILWRLNNGELDNVNPKIIVLLAGTNNLDKMPPDNADQKVADITRGIKAILEICQRKAPGATIVLMGITARNDSVAVMPIINRINDNLLKFADGKKIRYLNINDKLADRDGKLFPGMTIPDHIHLDIRGYRVWADALKPIFTELLGPPAKQDQAPPPTGDPRATQ